MGLKDIRATIIERLLEGNIQHELTRGGEIDEKNLLVTGQISILEVIELLNSTKGHSYSKSKHHMVSKIDVHIFKPKKDNLSWYIKCYLIEPDVWFISVHH